MKKKITAITLVICATIQMTYTTGIPVIDVAHIALDEKDELLNYIEYVCTHMNTLKQYEQQVVELARFGDPAQLKNLPGVRYIAELIPISQQLQYKYLQNLQRAFNPSSFRSDLNNVLSTYENPDWNGFTSTSGVQVTPYQGNYEFATARWGIVDQLQNTLSQLESQRQQLEKQLDWAAQALQNATTDSEVQKYHAVVNDLNTAFANISARASEVAQQSALQDQKFYVGQEVLQASQTEQKSALFQQSLENDFSVMPTRDYNKAAHWNQ